MLGLYSATITVGDDGEWTSASGSIDHETGGSEFRIGYTYTDE